MEHRFISFVRKLSYPAITVLGDPMVDRYTWGRVSRVSPEAPIVVLSADRQEVRLGGAAGVASLLRGLGATVDLVGVAGGDATAGVAYRLLDEIGIGRTGVVCDPDRVTTLKDRFLGLANDRHPQQVLRVDHETTGLIRQPLEEQVIEALSGSLTTSSALLISDYGKGVCTPSVLNAAIDYAGRLGLPVLVDPARGATWAHYARASLVVPNRLEAELASGISIKQVEDARRAAQQLRGNYGLSAVIIKLDSDGMLLNNDEHSGVHIPTRAREVYDITGAGDMVLAALGIAIASGYSLEEAATLANAAAGLEVERWGVAPISRSDLIRDALEHSSLGTEGSIISVDEFAELQRYYKSKGRDVFIIADDGSSPPDVAKLQAVARRGVVFVAVQTKLDQSASFDRSALELLSLRWVAHVVPCTAAQLERIQSHCTPELAHPVPHPNVSPVES